MEKDRVRVTAGRGPVRATIGNEGATPHSDRRCTLRARTSIVAGASQRRLVKGAPDMRRLVAMLSLSLLGPLACSGNTASAGSSDVSPTLASIQQSLFT